MGQSIDFSFEHIVQRRTRSLKAGTFRHWEEGDGEEVWV